MHALTVTIISVGAVTALCEGERRGCGVTTMIRDRHRTRPDTLARCVGIAILALSAGHDRVAAATLPGVTVQALAVDPTNAQIVYAGTTFGVYKTMDGGANWLRVDSGVQDTNVLALAIDPNAPCTIYGGVETFSATFNWNSVLIRSTNCGASWEYVFPTTALARSVRSLAFTNANPSTVYWSEVKNLSTPGRPFDSAVGRLTGLTSSEHFFLTFDNIVVATDPANPCTAYAATQFAGTVYRNTSCTDWNWTAVGTALSGTVIAIAAHPTNQATLLAGTAAGGIYKKVDALSPWVSVATVAGNIRSIAYQPGSSLVAYAAGSAGVLYKTVDGGGSWTAASTIGFGIASLAVSAADPTSVYAGGESFVVKIRPGAAGFTDPALIAGSTQIKAVHILELRARIDGIRAAKGLGAQAWGPAPTARSTVVLAQHILDLRTALALAYVVAGIAQPTYTDPTLASGSTIRVVHITELRSAVVAIE
jgi:hypothetical protein